MMRRWKAAGTTSWGPRKQLDPIFREFLGNGLGATIRQQGNAPATDRGISSSCHVMTCSFDVWIGTGDEALPVPRGRAPARRLLAVDYLGHIEGFEAGLSLSMSATRVVG